MSLRKRMPKKPMADINVTPMVDVMLVLLIIFMVSAPLMKGSVKVDLPEGSQRDFNAKEAPLIVTLDKESKLFVGDELVSTVQLGDVLHSANKDAHNKRVYVKADKSLEYGEIMALMDQIHALGYHLSLVSSASKK